MWSGPLALVSGSGSASVGAASTWFGVGPLGRAVVALAVGMASSTSNGCDGNVANWSSLSWLTATTGPTLHLSHSRYRLACSSLSPASGLDSLVLACVGSTVSLPVSVRSLRCPAECLVCDLCSSLLCVSVVGAVAGAGGSSVSGVRFPSCVGSFEWPGL